MPPDTQFRVSPTFPLDKSLIRRFRWKKILRSPVTWAVGIGVLTLGTIAGLRVPGLSFLAGVAAVGLFKFWQSKNGELEADAIQEIIRTSNAQQDAELTRIVNELHAHHQDAYATCLGKFLLLKQHIEQALHAEGKLTRRAEELEVLVDRLCSAVCSQLTQIVRVNQRLPGVLTSSNPKHLEAVQNAISDAQGRIRHAYTALYETAQSVTATDPDTSRLITRANNDSVVMDRLIEKLREENEIAQRVKERLKDVEI